MKAALVLVLLPTITGALVVYFFRRIRDGGEKHPILRIITGNLLVLFFLASIAVVAGEVYYRYVSDTTDALALARTTQVWYQRHWHRNSNGVRDDVEYAAAIHPGKRRVTFIGDSFAAGHGVPNVEDRFVNLIRHAHPEWEVHLIADSGWDTGEHLRGLATRLDNGEQLDEVVLVYCLNDIEDLLPAFAAATERVRANRQSWLERSFFYSAMRARMALLLDPELRTVLVTVLGGYTTDGVWHRQAERLDSLRRQVETHGGRFAVVVFPFLHRVGREYPYSGVHRQLDEFWRQRGVPTLDLLSVFQGLPSDKIIVNRSDAHPNEFAHGLAAKAIDMFLRQQMIAPTPVGR
jgi:hypothetical protein